MRFAQLLPSATVLALVGCMANVTVGGIRKEPLAAGTTRTFAASHARVLSAAREAVIESGFTVEDSRRFNDTTWMIIGMKKSSLLTHGVLVRVVVEEPVSGTSVVRVLKKTKQSSLTARQDYVPRILSYIEFKLR